MNAVRLSRCNPCCQFWTFHNSSAHLHTLLTMKKTKFSKPESDHVIHCVLCLTVHFQPSNLFKSFFTNLVTYTVLLPRLYLSKYTNFSSYFLRLLSVRYGEAELWIQNVSKFKMYADLSFKDRIPRLLSRWQWFTFKYYVSHSCPFLALFLTITNVLKLKALISKMCKTRHCCFGHFWSWIYDVHAYQHLCEFCLCACS